MPVGLTDYVAPLGLFPIAHDDDLLGAYRSVADVTARDAIPAPRRKEGMLVRTNGTGETWVLGAGLTNGDWTLYTTGIEIDTYPETYSNVSRISFPYQTRVRGSTSVSIDIPSFTNGEARRIIARAAMKAPMAVSSVSSTGSFGDVVWYHSYDDGNGGFKDLILFETQVAGPTYQIRSHVPGSALTFAPVANAPGPGKLFVSGDWTFYVTATTVEAYQRIDVSGPTRTYTAGGGGAGFGGYIASGGPGGVDPFSIARGGGEWIYVTSVPDGRIYKFRPGDASGAISVAYNITPGYEPRGITCLDSGEVALVSVNNILQVSVGILFVDEDGVLAALNALQDGGSGDSTNATTDGKYIFYLALGQGLYRVDRSGNPNFAPVPSPATINSTSRVAFDGSTILVTCSNGYLWRVNPNTLETISLQQVAFGVGVGVSGIAIPPSVDAGLLYLGTTGLANDTLVRLETKDHSRELMVYDAVGYVGSGRKLTFDPGATVSYDASSNSVNVAVVGRPNILRNGSAVGARPSLNLLGAGVASAVDNPGQNRIDITFSGGGGGGTGDNGSALRATLNSDLAAIDSGASNTDVLAWGYPAIVTVDGFAITARKNGADYDIVYYDASAATPLGVIQTVTSTATVSEILIRPNMLLVAEDNSVRLYDLSTAIFQGTPALSTTFQIALTPSAPSSRWRGCIAGDLAYFVGGATNVKVINLNAQTITNAFTHTVNLTAICAGPGASMFASDEDGNLLTLLRGTPQAQSTSVLSTANVGQTFFDLKFDGKYVWGLHQNALYVFDPASSTLSSAFVIQCTDDARLHFDGLSMLVGQGSIAAPSDITIARYTYDGSAIVKVASILTGSGAGDGRGIAVTRTGDVFVGGNLAQSATLSVNDGPSISLHTQYQLSAITPHAIITNSTTADHPDTLSTSAFNTNVYLTRAWVDIIVGTPTTGGDTFDISAKVNGTIIATQGFVETGTGTFYMNIDLARYPAVTGDTLSLEIAKNPAASDAMNWNVRFGFAWRTATSDTFSVDGPPPGP